MILTGKLWSNDAMILTGKLIMEQGCNDTDTEIMEH